MTSVPSTISPKTVRTSTGRIDMIDQVKIVAVIRYSKDGGTTWTEMGYEPGSEEDAEAYCEVLRKAQAPWLFKVSRKKVSVWDVTIFRTDELESARRKYVSVEIETGV